MTIRERKGKLDGVNLSYIGDGNNMCNSLIVGCLTCGMNVSVAVPEGYDPHPAVLDFAKDYPQAFKLLRKPPEAVKDADVVVTDVWASMGQEAEAQARKEAFAGYQINKELMSAAKNDAIVLHCLPAKRGQEITADIFEAHAETIFTEAENRLHAQKAVLTLLMK